MSNPDFTNSTFARIACRIAERASGRASALTYGMWNPAFCSADAAAEALAFLAELRADIEHWEYRAAQAIEAQRAGTTKIDPVHESAVVADDAPIMGMGKSDQEGA